MNWKRAFTWVLVALLSIGLTVPAKAILGIGDIVFDPTNYAEAIQQLIQLEQQYTQLVQTYEQVRAHYEHALRMAQQVPVNMVARYRALATPWRFSSATNTYGTTGGWINSINTGLDVAERLLAVDRAAWPIRHGPGTDSRRSARPGADLLWNRGAHGRSKSART